jgi:hypothetical protein
MRNFGAVELCGKRLFYVASTRKVKLLDKAIAEEKLRGKRNSPHKLVTSNNAVTSGDARRRKNR